jgi:hypothetical protein
VDASIVVVWFDPGGDTGWALWNGENYSTGELAQHEVWDFLDHIRKAYPNAVFGYEEFRVREDTNRADLSSVEVIGIIKEWARQKGVKVEDQHSSQAKHYFTDKRLKDAGLWVKGQPHGMDALRHLCYFRKDMLL